MVFWVVIDIFTTVRSSYLILSVIFGLRKHCNKICNIWNASGLFAVYRTDCLGGFSHFLAAREIT
jgi:hypothetical protein